MENSNNAYVVEVGPDVVGLPRLVGPFAMRSWAEEWGVSNIQNGTWNVAPLTHPTHITFPE